MNSKQTIHNENTAAIIAATHRKKRPISLLKLAQILKSEATESGSLDKLAQNIGLSASMLRRFLAVDKLSPKLKQLVDERILDSIDAVAELSGLKKDTQDKIFDCLKEERLNSGEIRALVRLCRHHPETKVADFIRLIKSDRNIKIYVFEFIIRDGVAASSLSRRFKNALKADFTLDITANNFVGRLKVKKVGMLEISSAAKRKGLTKQNFVQLLSEGKLL